MTPLQKTIKYLAVAFALFLTICIIGGIASAVFSISFIFDNSAAVGETQSYDIEGDVNSLDIDISAADLDIRLGDGFALESNLKKLTVDVKNGGLVITESSRVFGKAPSGGKVVLTLPRECDLDYVEIDTGAGKFEIECLSAQVLSLELGAGEVKIEELNVTKKTEIDGGAGRLAIKGGSIKDLDMDMGVGELVLEAAVYGDSELDMGVGSVDIKILGTKDDYKITVSKGLGAITLDGKGVSDGETVGSGTNKLEINGGVGDIKIGFSADEQE